MPAAPIQWREPDSFTAGDTLLFQRSLPDYLPSDGWTIRLTITQNLPNGAQKVADVSSTPDSTNTYHVFNVPNFCAGLAAGVYVLSEEIVNVAGNANAVPPIAAGTRQQIYVRPDFVIADDLTDGLASAPVLTRAQKKLIALDALQDKLYAFKFSETEDLRSRFKEKDLKDVQDQIKYWESRRILEMQQERARNGQNIGNVQEAVFAIG